MLRTIDERCLERDVFHYDWWGKNVVKFWRNLSNVFITFYSRIIYAINMLIYVIEYKSINISASRRVSTRELASRGTEEIEISLNQS